MVDFGFLSKDNESNEYVPTKMLWAIPMYESVQAWFPSPATDDLKNDIRLEEYLIDNPLTTVYVKVIGDSMIDEWIKPWDCVIVDKSKKAGEGDVIVADVDGEYTLKYFFKENGKPVLKAANNAYSDIYPQQNLTIFGVVIGQFRKYF